MLFLGLWGLPNISAGALLTVTSLADNGAGSLRNAIAISSSNDVINFAVPGTITLTSGELFIGKNLSIIGPGAASVTVSGNQLSRVFSIQAGRIVAIQGLTIANGRTADFGGGGIANAGTLTLVSCVIAGNVSTPSHGGGVYNAGGNLTVDSCTVSNNSAAVVGGGLFNKNGTMTVTRSTISGNSCGVQGAGIASEDNSLSLINCTISGNRSDLFAGGVLIFGDAFFNHTTIAFNSAPVGAGVYNAGQLMYENCILAHNRMHVNLLDASNDTTSLGNNISSDSSGSLDQPTDQFPVNPKLRPLGAHGGPTLTHALDPLSPAINAGNATGPSTDQRGRPRSQGAAADIGAFESPVPVLVTTSNDSGPGSLRAAIQFANTNSGTDIILFHPPGVLKQIALSSSLPIITDPVLLDHGFINQLPPLVELNGSGSAITHGLRLATHDSLVRGISIIGFSDTGIEMSGFDVIRNQVMQCYVGVDVAGQAVPNQSGFFLNGAQENIIGTDGDGLDDEAEGNLISGNDYGILMFVARQNRVAGNLIGTDATGSQSIPNQDAIYMEFDSVGNVIGTDGSDDAFNEAERNIISGNTDRAVILTGANKVAGNFIGLDRTGTTALPNKFGVQVTEGGGIVGTDNLNVGDPVERNIISGNTLAAIIIAGSVTTNARVSGNFIGTDVDGAFAIPNDAGISISSGAHDVLIGGSGPGLGNVISGNTKDGLRIQSNSSRNRVEGNHIGVSSGSPMPNGHNGILIGVDHETNNIIGGLLPGAGNVIAHNQRAGVHVGSVMGGVVVGNSILGNSIFANGGLGIDLVFNGAIGVTPNDADDLDSGPNGLQNFPVLEAVASDGNNTYITGTLESGTGIYHLEFFSETNPDGSGYGEGQLFLGSASVEIVSGPDSVGFVAILPTGLSLGETVTATASGVAAGTSEFSAGLAVAGIEFPEIVAGPASTNVNIGQSVTLCVTATGTEPLTYQWRLNGVNIPGATNVCYVIAVASLESGGSYTVLVANPAGVVTTEPALVQVNFVVSAVGDNLAAAITFLSDNGAKRGSNLGTTSEAGEPRHAGKPGGKSVWYRWIPASSGIATLRTLGSAFDTLLAVYERTNPVPNVTNLVLVISDEDSGGFLTSQVRFNAVAGRTYWIAVDGYGGTFGNFAVTWSLEVTPQVLPVITTFPIGATVAPGTNYTFHVAATGTGLTYQWYLNGILIAGATNNFHAVPMVTDQTVGSYTVRIGSGSRFVDSPPVSLQLNLTGAEVQTVAVMDKFLDAAADNPLRLGVPGGGGGGFLGRIGSGGSALSRGYSGTQVFNTRGASSQPGEPNHCNVLGGASQWCTYLAEHTGVLFLNTDGSAFDSVLAVYTGTVVTDFSNLVSEACDNNSGLDGKDSALTVAVQPGRLYYIAVDGVNAASGVLMLNYSLVIPATFTSLGKNIQGAYRMRVSGRPAMYLTVEASTDLLDWVSLLTTNVASGVFEFTDNASPGFPKRAYRALMRP